MSFTWPILGFLLQTLLSTYLQVEVSPKMLSSTIFLDWIGTSTVWLLNDRTKYKYSTTTWLNVQNFNLITPSVTFWICQSQK